MNLDFTLAVFLNSFAGKSHALDAVIIFCAEYLPYLLVALFAAFAFSRSFSSQGKRILFFEGLGAGLIARFGFVEIIRLFVHRLRPFADGSLTALLTEPSFSFPSGHAAFFFALSAVAYAHNKQWGLLFFLASAVVGIARVVAGAHYPSDIFGGAVLGIAVGAVTVWLRRKLFRGKNDSFAI